MPTIYHASDWISSGSFIYSHAQNRSLNPEHHSHDFFEVVYLFNGSVSHRCNQKMVEMRSGDVVFLRPGDAHTLVRNTPTLELYSISATVQEVLPLLEAYQINERICSCGDPPFFSLAQQKYAISSMFENLPQSSPTQHCEQLRIILGTTIHAFLLPHSQIPNNSLSILFKQMNQADALAEGVPAMLRLCHLSHAQLCRVVKKQTGKTPQQYVRELRLLRAYDLIQSTNMAFEDIANAVGYCSLSHFATTFKGRFGVTLSELRKQKRMIL